MLKKLKKFFNNFWKINKQINKIIEAIKNKSLRKMLIMYLGILIFKI